ncbi:IS5 family transposase [Mangrovactinospora gilvigrisea]|uniref:IS5 family transposase n=1 Tax=Mangrovactinospora gilvigrisea TaxID=1428644 RepID=A0A1J7BJ96_9ACTN|nr:IS5/IS1182 family transposase [Mangrovactinospora gilvigrisea]OIV38710.1 IS5 family transposase [Mangrovactinospora gilvigrisea]
MLVYPSGLDLSSSALRYLARELGRHRIVRRTRWRRLTSGRQALLVLAHLRCGHTYAQLAAGFQIGVANVYRYIPEAVDLLAALAPDLATAAAQAGAKAHVILDGTLLPIDRIKADRPFSSGKHRKHGMNIHVIADPVGRLLWASPALPGAVHDIRAARTHGIIDALTRAGAMVFADKGYRGARGTIRIPIRGRGLPRGPKLVNITHAKIRTAGERANVTLKTWRLLRKLRCSTTRITTIAQAILTLHHSTSTAG